MLSKGFLKWEEVGGWRLKVGGWLLSCGVFVVMGVVMGEI